MSEESPKPAEKSPTFDAIKLIAKDAAEKPLPPSPQGVSEQRALFRAEQTRDAIHWIVIWALRTVGIAGILVVTLRILHLAIPVNYQFISAEQQARIDSMFLSGSVAVGISRHLRQVMGWENDEEE